MIRGRRNCISIAFICIAATTAIVFFEIKTSLFQAASFLKESQSSFDTAISYSSSINQKQQHQQQTLPPYPDTFDKFPNGTKCFLWEENSDHWWTHHPMWSVSTQNDTHTCFGYIDDSFSMLSLHNLDIYKNQFMSDCTNVTTRYLWNSGWGADIGYGVALPLVDAVRTGNPLAMRPYEGFWHYAAMKPDGSNPACPAKDMTCYFLDLTNCQPTYDESKVTKSFYWDNYMFHRRDEAYTYVTRQRQWLRKAIYDNEDRRRIQSQLQGVNCSVMHVRRADVILHHQQARKYYPIVNYLAKLPRRRRQNVLLLTDDANAIDEAHEFFPNVKWSFFNRTRFRGVSGGWENQIPSNDTKKEVITLLTTMELVCLCDTIVRGPSSFANLLTREMEQTWKTKLQSFDVHEGDGNAVGWNNSMSDKKLEERLATERQGRKAPKFEKNGP